MALQLLGDKLVGKNGEISTTEALKGKKVIGLYFSAHWCGPCRTFTPNLAEMYTSTFQAKGMEIIFVSSDRDDAAFSSYHGEQPWLALPYANRAAKDKLSKMFKVNGIPSLVILDATTGTTITTDGRSAITEDPSGKDFPWKPPTLWESLGDEFLKDTAGETVDITELKSSAKYIGLYFSAHWCPPCRSFTPSLITSYNDHLKAKGLEIVFVSSDRDSKAFQEYFGEMPWLGIPNGDARKNKLSKLFNVEGIPSFVVIDAATGETITTDARSDVSADPTGVDFPWRPKALNNISAGKGLDKINEETCFCVLLDGCDESTKAAAKAVLEQMAEASAAAKSPIVYMYAPTNEGPVGQLRSLCHLETPKSTPQMLILDIPERCFYGLPATEVSATTISSSLEAFTAKALDRTPFGA